MSPTNLTDHAAVHAEKAEDIADAAFNSHKSVQAVTHAILAVYYQLAEITDLARNGAIDLGNALCEVKDTVEGLRDTAIPVDDGDTDRT